MSQLKSPMGDLAWRAPLNKAAALVQTKDKSVPMMKNINQRHWKICPRLFDKDRVEKILKNSSFVDLTGYRFGRFQVVGAYDDGTAGASLWVVRCVCGDFETRRAKSIRNPNNKQDRCGLCRHMLHLRRMQEYNALGYNRTHTFGDV